MVKPKKASYFSFDKNPQAVRSTSLNSTLQEINNQAEEFDLLDYRPDNLPKFFESLEMDSEDSFDVILSNPPWMISKPLNGFIDSGNYDPEEKFLLKLFEFVKNHLNPNRGVFFLIYSDLAQILGLQSVGRIEELCKLNGLTVVNILEFEGLVNSQSIISEFDYIKQKSSVVIYEISF